MAWLNEPASMRQWERIAVWLALFACMGWRFAHGDTAAPQAAVHTLHSFLQHIR